MKLSEIRRQPTTLFIRDSADNQRFHESLLRSYQLVQKIKELLDADTPASVIMEIIDDVEEAEQVQYSCKSRRCWRCGISSPASPPPPDYDTP